MRFHAELLSQNFPTSAVPCRHRHCCPVVVSGVGLDGILTSMLLLNTGIATLSYLLLPSRHRHCCLLVASGVGLGGVGWTQSYFGQTDAPVAHLNVAKGNTAYQRKSRGKEGGAIKGALGI